MRLWCGAIVRVCALALAVAGAVLAGTITYGLDSVFSGTAPLGNQPWITFTFTNDSLPADTVDLTIFNDNLLDSEFVSDIFLNFNPILDPTILSFAYLPSTQSDDGTVTLRSGDYGGQWNVAGGGYFDINISFPTSSQDDRFGAGESITYRITCAGCGLVPEYFSTRSADKQGQSYVEDSFFYNAAHVQSIGAAGASGWITGGPGRGPLEEVPEPDVSVLLGGGIVAIGLLRRYLK